MEYKSVNASSDRIVTRNRSCFVEGQISTVTVWFVDQKSISSEKAIVNATSGQGNHYRRYAFTSLYDVIIQFIYIMYITYIMLSSKKVHEWIKNGKSQYTHFEYHYEKQKWDVQTQISWNGAHGVYDHWIPM